MRRHTCNATNARIWSALRFEPKLNSLQRTEVQAHINEVSSGSGLQIVLHHRELEAVALHDDANVQFY